MKSIRKKVVKRRSHHKQKDPYVNINWDKARVLFMRPTPPEESQRRLPAVKSILFALAKAGETGLTFFFEAEKRGVEFMHPGINMNKRIPWQTKQVLRQLNRQRYVRIKEYDDGRVTVMISKRGLTRSLTYELEKLSVSKQKRWDRKWRVVLFDIPIKYGRIRDIFRMRLKQLGLYQLQESVYVSPYSCFDEVEFLRELYGVAFTVRYLLAERIESDGALRQHFYLT